MVFQWLALVWTAVALLAVSLMMLAVGLVAPAQTQGQPQAQAPGATLVIHVQNVSPKGGILRLGLYDEARYPDDKSAPVAFADVKAVTLNNIAPGTYAIQAYQDANSNDRMDTSWIGLPLEPYGFSRNARPVLSKPGFARTKFDVADGMNMQTLHLQNAS